MANVETTRRSAIGVIASMVGAMGLPAVARVRHEPPNILFILADDLGFADLSCYGRRDFTTPVLDKLAKQGVILRQAYANSAVCSATRTAIVSGKYQYRFAVGLEEPVATADSELRLPDNTPTLPSRLKALGYRTALFGKWHVGSLPNNGPTRYGYDHFWGIASGGADYFSHRARINQTSPRYGLFDDDKPVEKSGYLTDLLADEASKWIEAKDHRPFLVSLHFNAPHWPWEGPNDQEHSVRLKDLRDLSGGSLATYAEMVRAMDRAIGRVLDILNRSGKSNDTIVVFTSDNGGERFSDVWPLTGLKGELLEGGIRVPLIVRWPGVIPPSTTCDQLFMSMDFLPTLLAAAGGGALRDSETDGVNLLEQLKGRASPSSRTVFWRYKASEQAAARSGRWKYLKIRGQEHLFDIESDPRERVELAVAEPDILAKLKAEYARWNAGMLPYPSTSFSEDVKGHYADRY